MSSGAPAPVLLYLMRNRYRGLQVQMVLELLNVENCSGLSRTSHIKLFQVGWGNAFWQQAIEDTGSYLFYSDHF